MFIRAASIILNDKTRNRDSKGSNAGDGAMGMSRGIAKSVPRITAGQWLRVQTWSRLETGTEGSRRDGGGLV